MNKVFIIFLLLCNSVYAFDYDKVLTILESTNEGRKAIRNMELGDVELYECEYIKSYYREPGETEWKIDEWGGMTFMGRNPIEVYIPRTKPDEIAARIYVHEACHVVGGKEEEAYTAETRFALEYNPKIAKDDFITSDGEINKKAINKFIDVNYAGFYTKSEYREYKRDSDGNKILEFGDTRRLQ